MSTALLHTAGALVGSGVGLWMLKTDRVDCEGWDIFSVWAGKHEMTDEQLQALAEKDPAYQEEKRQEEIRKTKRRPSIRFEVLSLKGACGRPMSSIDGRLYCSTTGDCLKRTCGT